MSELKYIEDKIDKLTLDTRNYMENYEAKFLNIFGGLFSEPSSSSGNVSKYDIESTITSQVGNNLREQAVEEVERAIESGKTYNFRGSLLRPAGVRAPKEFLSINIYPRFEATINLRDDLRQIYSYKIVVIIRYDATIKGSLSSVESEFNLPTIRGEATVR